MKINDFIQNFANQFDETDASEFQATTEFRQLDEWSSLSSLAIISMIDEHEITRKAYEQKAEIIETANEMSREISQGTKEYANNLLNSTEKVLTDSLAKLEKDISEAANIMQMSLEGTIKTIQDSKKELQ